MNFSDYLNPKLVEALKTTKSKDFKLQSSSKTDSSVVETIALYAESHGMTITQGQNIFDEKYQKLVDSLSKAPKINKNAIENAPNAIAFNMSQEINLDGIDFYDKFGIEREDLLDRDYFYDLTLYVIGENARFYPLKNPYQRKTNNCERKR